ncbi:pyridoxal 4-dehydrogenase [Actibacterium mucosum KCTC 23349]|uniref:Pyridoxal 4-dehydrogenase n=1 Tax=Actibacterium mucosum KCTC 23349 TaxID=1454373 RepID=A0A037ZJC7_9RHOB|nr:aldo/keto reductase [Actibacterium mucosum]KAJ55667.1 pyridoxal 4-dehydrogenase [Actibacterium mucosum KCTC 23349]
MQRNRIAATDVYVTDVSFGCSGIGNLYHAISDAEADTVLGTAWDNGIRYFDVAPRYGRGLAEQRLAAFLKGRDRSSYVISTKVGRLLSPGRQLAEAEGFVNPLPNDVSHDYSGDGIEAAIDGSCTRLGTDYLDIVYVHDIGTYTHGFENEGHYRDLMRDGLDRLERLKRQGRIGAFGLGVNENEVCIDILKQTPLDVILLAGRLTLLDRSAEEELVPLCKVQGTSLVLGGIFNSGILATGPVDGASYDYAPASPEILQKVGTLQARADEFGVPLATAALQFARRHSAVVSVLLGTSKSTSLLRNLAALDAPWPPEADVLLR